MRRMLGTGTGGVMRGMLGTGTGGMVFGAVRSVRRARCDAILGDRARGVIGGGANVVVLGEGAVGAVLVGGAGGSAVLAGGAKGRAVLAVRAGGSAVLAVVVGICGRENMRDEALTKRFWRFGWEMSGRGACDLGPGYS